MKLLVLFAALLTGCGTYVLGYVSMQTGKTAEDRQADMIVCQDRAKAEANSGERVAGSFLAGLTIIGAPIAIAEERRKQREVFTECMTSKGYSVRPAS